MTVSDMTHDIVWLKERLDRHGADFDAWPDAAEAASARRIVLGDRQARAALEEAKALDALMQARADRLAADVSQGGLVERVAGAVLAALPSRPQRAVETRRWIAGLAASFVVAAFLGGAADRLLMHEPADALELVAVDTLLYGPMEIDFR
jgi:hypothetical protein